MKVNLDQLLLDYEGDPIAVTAQRAVGNFIAEVPVTKKVKQPDGTEKDEPQNWTLKRLCVNALSTPHEADKGMEPAKVTERWQFAMALNAGGEQELEADKLTELRKRLALFNTQYGLMLVGRACDLLKG